MEAAEDASLEAAIGWLVQTILGILQFGKLDAWIRRAGFAVDIEKLKSEVERVEMVVAAVKGRALGNKPLSRSLARLKELLYDADDVIDELDYYRLQQQVEGVTCDDPESMHAAEERSRGSAAEDIPSGSGGNLRSKYWKEFNIIKWDNGKAVEAKCIHCDATPIKCISSNGTSVLRNHLDSKACTEKRAASDQLPNPSRTGDATANAAPVLIGNSSSRKRRRTGEEISQTTTANTQNPWDKAELYGRIPKITSQLHDIQEKVSDFLKMLGLDSATCSVHHLSTTSDKYLETSSLVQRKVYGRVAEKNYIMKLITKDRSDGVTILPIVGIAGVGKTALAQYVYNHPEVKNQFQRIWVWVSHRFDEVRLTKEMLDFVSRERQQKGSPERNERHERISSFAKLQEILKGHMEYQSERFLLILDDIWDSPDNYRWNKLFAPLISGRVKGNVILVTTRNLSVAQRIGTLEPVKLGALENDDFWLLFKSHAFGDENYKGHQNLSIIGQKIAEKLKGNPLAAESTGDLLRKKLETDHWSNILKNEKWKSLQLDGGIMPVFKLSYDQLPYHLQQCFSYCSIYPYNYQFLGEELVRIWISQEFVKCDHSSQRLEGIGWCYLTDLVNLGFFQQVESNLGSQICYTICGLMHDFARMVSRTECAAIGGLRYNEMFPTTRHLSIVTDSAYIKDEHGNIPRNEKFEEYLRNTVTSVGKLRTLVLIGQYDSFFFGTFQDIFQKAQNLRLLQMSATSAQFGYFLCSLVNPAYHLRYLKHNSDGVDVTLPQVLTKFYHLQVLDVGSDTKLPTILDGMDNLVSLRHLVADKGVYSSIASIGNMTSLQELHDFKVGKERLHSSIGRIDEMASLQELQEFSVQDSSGFEITQLQSMNELVQLGVSHLENVKNREVAYGAGLRNKEHLENLHLSWKHTIETAKEVFEGLEPHLDLKHLRISGYNGATFPTWLDSNISVTSLQTLHLEDCGEWRILPSMERLPFLTKLKLIKMQKVTEVWVPSLEELVLIEMPKLKRCSCTSVGDLNSSLRALQIEECHSLKEFDLFESYDKFEIEQKSWLPGLQKLIMRNCPNLKVLNPLPPSTTLHELRISEVSTLPNMEGSSSQTLTIGPSGDYLDHDIDESSDELRTLDDKILAFHNLRNLELMSIHGCRNLTSIWFKGFSQLVSLKSLEIVYRTKLLPPRVMPEYEDMTAADRKIFPSLTLRLAPVLKKLELIDCSQMTQLLIEEEEDIQSNLTSAREAEASGHPDDALTGSAPVDALYPISSLKEIHIKDCPYLTFKVGNKGLSRFTSLEKLAIIKGCELLRSLVHKGRNDDPANGRWLLPLSLQQLKIRGDSPETLQPCFMGNQTCLTKLDVSANPSLKSLELHSCTSLENLVIVNCNGMSKLSEMGLPTSLQELELQLCTKLIDLPAGLHMLPSLKSLTIHSCGGISRLPERGLPCSLEKLIINNCVQKLTDECRKLATRKLKVIIGGVCIN